MTAVLCPDLLRSSPQLASLELLVQSAEVAIIALCAAHPAIEGLDPAIPIDRLADRIVTRLASLLDSIDGYRQLLDDIRRLESSDSAASADDIDF